MTNTGNVERSASHSSSTLSPPAILLKKEGLDVGGTTTSRVKNGHQGRGSITTFVWEMMIIWITFYLKSSHLRFLGI